MVPFVAGLVLFLGVHSIRIFAEGWRAERIRRMGEPAWKGVYSLVSILGFVLIVWGYGLARKSGIDLWTPPAWGREMTEILTVPAFILIAAAYIPGTRMKSALGHPMLFGTMFWGVGHLFSNGRLAGVLLFASFFVWSALAFWKARERDRKAGVTYKALGMPRDMLAVIVGCVAYAVFAVYLHGPLIGTRPFG
jgi:uncharacterized membrane protein